MPTILSIARMSTPSISYIIEKMHIVAGFILNALLLYLIRWKTKLSLGTYKHLLFIFASFDLFLIFLHAIAEPRVVIVDAIFGVVADTFVEDVKVTSFYCACFTIPFTLMNIHFLYRYWAVQSPHRVVLFSRPRFICLLVTIPLFESVSWEYFGFTLATTLGEDSGIGVDQLRSEFYQRYDKHVEGGWIVMDFWPNGDLNVRVARILALADVAIVGTFVVAIGLGVATYRGLKEATFSAHARKLQLKLLQALTAQTVVPLLFVYIPYFVVLNFPFLRLPSGPMAHLCMLLTACFPAWDAVIIITLMTDYRDALIAMAIGRCAKKTTNVVTYWQPSAETTSRMGLSV